MTTFIAPVSTQGHMTFNEVKNECGKEGWVPLVILRVATDEGTRIVLPVFQSEDTCKKWCKRNLPKAWKLSGACYLNEDDLKIAESRGWFFELFQWPRLVKDIVEIDVEPMDLSGKPTVNAK